MPTRNASLAIDRVHRATPSFEHAVILRARRYEQLFHVNAYADPAPLLCCRKDIAMQNRTSHSVASNSLHRPNCRKVMLVCSVWATLFIPAFANGDGIDPKAILKSMSDYLARQPTLSAQFDSSVEVITPDLEKIQFDSSTTLEMKRPDKLKLHRTGGYAAVNLTFDGTTLTVQDLNNKTYAQAAAKGTTDALVDRMRNELGIGAPGADFLLADVYTALSEDVLSAKYIGQGVIGGVECEHLAFRNADTDWQLWVRAGKDPIPCKMVITSKTLAGAPQYTVEIRDWKSGQTIADATFKFNAEGAGSKVELKQLTALDEVPPAVGEGEQQ